MRGYQREREMIAGGAPIDCAQPLSPHITAKATKTTAVGDDRLGEAQYAHQRVCRGRNDETRGHEAFDVAVIGDESVDELADGIGK